MPECLEDCSYEILNLEPFDDPDYYYVNNVYPDKININIDYINNYNFYKDIKFIFKSII